MGRLRNLGKGDLVKVSNTLGSGECKQLKQQDKENFLELLISLSSQIGMAKPGDRVKLSIWRDQALRDLSVTLVAARGSAQASTKGDESAGAVAAGSVGRLGLALRPLSPIERQQAQVENGLLVQGVQGASQRAGVMRGDVLLAINGQPIGAAEDIQRVMTGQPKQVALLLWRAGDRLFVPVPLG